MGRKSKGDRHTFMLRVPHVAGSRVRGEATTLGCYYTDYLAHLICRHLGVATEIPTGDVVEHDDPPDVGDGRVQFITRVPLAVAQLVKEHAEARGISYSDYLATVVCEAHEVDFEPRVKPKALREWAKAPTAGGQLSMTG